MATTALSTTTLLSSRRNSQHMYFQPSSIKNEIPRTAHASVSKDSFPISEESDKCSSLLVNRRTVLASGVSLLGFPGVSLAVVKQGLLAGRIPGLSEPDEQELFLPPCPVSIADLGGTELDLRFSSSKEGRLFVIVAPVLRFSDDLGDNATIEKIGPPDKVISAFGPEMIGENVEGKVLSSSVAEHEGRTYYKFELEPPHIFITATAAGNRLYLFGVTGNGLQWKRHYKDLKKISDSFRVV